MQEKWIIPAGFVGWVRLDYSIKGAPPLPIEDGHYVIRLKRSARLATSSANDPSVDDNEYCSEDSTGLHKLTHSWPPNQGYAVQNAYAQGYLLPSRSPIPASPTIQYECVFVGTRSDFVSNSQNCSAWRPGETTPPEFPKRRPQSDSQPPGGISLRR